MYPKTRLLSVISADDWHKNLNFRLSPLVEPCDQVGKFRSLQHIERVMVYNTYDSDSTIEVRLIDL